MQILVVDDDSFSGQLTTAILEDAGYETVMVENAVAAVELLASEHDFCVVISDMNMPFVDGLELFATLRDEGCLLPFILLSGEDPVPLQRREPRLDACVRKDSDLEYVLPETLKRVLAARARK